MLHISLLSLLTLFSFLSSCTCFCWPVTPDYSLLSCESFAGKQASVLPIVHSSKTQHTGKKIVSLGVVGHALLKWFTMRHDIVGVIRSTFIAICYHGCYFSFLYLKDRTFPPDLAMLFDCSEVPYSCHRNRTAWHRRYF